MKRDDHAMTLRSDSDVPRGILRPVSLGGDDAARVAAREDETHGDGALIWERVRASAGDGSARANDGQWLPHVLAVQAMVVPMRGPAEATVRKTAK